jgi:hypothetical protein
MIGSGCARWSNLTEEVNTPVASSLARPIADDSTQIETILLRLSNEQSDALENAWSQTNEQALSLDLRKRLDQNGLRAGIIETVVPLTLQAMIDSIEQRLHEDPLEQIGVGANVTSHSRMLQCRLGQRKEVWLGSKRKEPLILFHTSDGSARGRSFDEPQLLFDLRAHPIGDGSVQLSVTPEIQFGPMKQKYVQQEYAIRRELKRDSVQWTELAVDRKFQPGQMLMLSATRTPRGLGEAFFSTVTAAGTREQLLMLVRIGPSPLDSAFNATKQTR